MYLYINALPNHICILYLFVKKDSLTLGCILLTLVSFLARLFDTYSIKVFALTCKLQVNNNFMKSEIEETKLFRNNADQALGKHLQFITDLRLSIWKVNISPLHGTKCVNRNKVLITNNRYLSIFYMYLKITHFNKIYNKYDVFSLHLIPI